MAQYHRVNRQPWVSCCDKCFSPLAAPWFWAPSKYAKHRNLCASCHDIKAATDRLRYEMFKEAR